MPPCNSHVNCIKFPHCKQQIFKTQSWTQGDTNRRGAGSSWILRLHYCLLLRSEQCNFHIVIVYVQYRHTVAKYSITNTLSPRFTPASTPFPLNP
jgi:hypothetical protein